LTTYYIITLRSLTVKPLCSRPFEAVALLSLASELKYKSVEEISDKITYLELIADGTFMNEFTAALFMPHTNIDNFPSVKALLAKQ